MTRYSAMSQSMLAEEQLRRFGASAFLPRPRAHRLGVREGAKSWNAGLQLHASGSRTTCSKNEDMIVCSRLARPLTFLATLALAACTSLPSRPARNAALFELDCPQLAGVPNARYVGPYRGPENELTAKDFARDLYCADDFKAKLFPHGFVTVFGSSRISEHNTTSAPSINSANDRLYAQIRSFAHHWTERYGATYPILSGAGPGLMEAANRGASEAGKSIGYTTYYDRNSSPTPAHPFPYVGDPTLALHKYNNTENIVTDGLIFTSIAAREDAMILHSAAIVIAPGGTGTEWETFQILETMKSHQLKSVPVYIVGDPNVYWKSFTDRLHDMALHNTLTLSDLNFIEYVDDPEDIVAKLRARLGLD